jgi:hypothetical protein
VPLPFLPQAAPRNPSQLVVDEWNKPRECRLLTLVPGDEQIGNLLG